MKMKGKKGFDLPHFTPLLSSVDISLLNNWAFPWIIYIDNRQICTCTAVKSRLSENRKSKETTRHFWNEMMETRHQRHKKNEITIREKQQNEKSRSWNLITAYDARSMVCLVLWWDDICMMMLYPMLRWLYGEMALDGEVKKKLFFRLVRLSKHGRVEVFIGHRKNGKYKQTEN